MAVEMTSNQTPVNSKRGKSFGRDFDVFEPPCAQKKKRFLDLTFKKIVSATATVLGHYFN